MEGARPDYLPFGRPNFGDEEIAAVTRVLRKGWVGMGPEVAAFEKELADYVSAPHVVAVSSCTAGLHLSLLVSGVGPGDEVICPSLTWCSSANAALYLGADVVFCDVELSSMCASVETIVQKLTKKTKAIVVVHLGGRAVDVEALRSAIPPSVVIVEDAAHALGSRYKSGQPVGSSENLTCFSFYANKNLSTAEGGAIAVADDAIAARLRSLRQHGLPRDAWQRYTHANVLYSGSITELGFKANYTDLQASIGRVQLRRQGDFHQIRLEIARAFCEAMTHFPVSMSVQEGVLDDSHARHLFLIQIPVEETGKSRDDLLSRLRGQNVGAAVHYPPLHRMPFYCRYSDAALPVTERIYERILTLPMSANMSLEDAGYVIDQLRHTLFSY